MKANTLYLNVTTEHEEREKVYGEDDILKNLSHFKIEYAKRPLLLDILNVKSCW